MDELATKRKNREKELSHKTSIICSSKNSSTYTIKELVTKFKISRRLIADAINNYGAELRENGMRFEVSKGDFVLTKRAVLNLAMLLDDSTLARRLRGEILNKEEENKLVTDEEQLLLLEIAQSSNIKEREIALSKYKFYKNKQTSHS